MWAMIEKLKRHGVLGLNQRNADYILASNPRRLYPLVDNKLRTKQLAIEGGSRYPSCTVHCFRNVRFVIFRGWFASVSSLSSNPGMVAGATASW